MKILDDARKNYIRITNSNTNLSEVRKEIEYLKYKDFWKGKKAKTLFRGEEIIVLVLDADGTNAGCGLSVNFDGWVYGVNQNELTIVDDSTELTKIPKKWL